MSSGEDSETAEWEREQMLRGTQSRGYKAQKLTVEKNKDAIDAAAARDHINHDIEKAQAHIELLKRKIGGTKVEMVKTEKKLEAWRNRMEQIEASNTLFAEIASLAKPTDILAFLENSEPALSNLPHDQKEMIDLLKKNATNASLPMDMDQ